MLANYKLQTPFKFFAIKIKQEKQIVIQSKLDFNRKQRSNLTRYIKECLILTGLVTQVNLLFVSLTNKEP